MNIINEKEECFETEMGVPTLTIELAKEQRMISYAGFRDAVLKGNNITISFISWNVIIRGESLLALWQQLQLLDVRVIRCSDSSIEAECSISQIEMLENDDDF